MSGRGVAPALRSDSKSGFFDAAVPNRYSGRMRVPIAVLVLLSTVPAARAELTRDTLRTVVRSCVLAKRSVGLPFPCREVELGSAGAPGYVVLQPPLSVSHMVVSPTADIAGIERPELRRPDASVYWQAALRARQLTVDALGGRVAVNEVGLAVNSAGGRTQDHLHIHIDCVQPRVLNLLRAHTREIGPGWAPFPVAIYDQRFFARRIDAADGLNPFGELASLPGHPDPGAVAMALLSAPTPHRGEDGYVMMAAVGPSSHAEDLLDHSCRLAADRKARRSHAR